MRVTKKADKCINTFFIDVNANLSDARLQNVAKEIGELKKCPTHVRIHVPAFEHTSITAKHLT